jgi:hypothetical protein
MKSPFVRLVLSLVVLAVVGTPLAHAQATRTWVSGVGDDANPCSRTAPCKTFAGAISKTAPGGEINVLDPGGFGAVTITKSITISSEGFEAGVLVSGTNGIIISAGAGDVVILRGLDIEGLGTGLDGIKFLTGGALHVEKCVVDHFTGSGINFSPGSGSAATASLYVKDSILRNNGNGILMAPSTVNAQGSISNTRMERNTNFGLKAQTGSTVEVSDSIAATSTNGFWASGGSVNVNLTRIQASNNSVGVLTDTGGIVRLAYSSISGNGTGVNNTGVFASLKNNMIDGNAANTAGAGTFVMITPL